MSEAAVSTPLSIADAAAREREIRRKMLRAAAGSITRAQASTGRPAGDLDAGTVLGYVVDDLASLVSGWARP